MKLTVTRDINIYRYSIQSTGIVRVGIFANSMKSCYTDQTKKRHVNEFQQFHPETHLGAVRAGQNPVIRSQ